MAKNQSDSIAIKAIKERIAELRKIRKSYEADWNKRIAYLQKAKKDDLLRLDGMIHEEMKVLHFIESK